MLSETKYFFFLSDILNKKVKRSDGSTIGRVVDVSVSSAPLKVYPEVVFLIVSTGLIGKRVKISISTLEPFELPIGHLFLKSDPDEIGVEEFTEPTNGISLLKETFLDKQILDTSGCKVVRVNDLHLLKEKNYIWVVHVDIGFRGIVRRLGWLQMLDTLMEWVFSYKPQERFVSWKYVSGLPQKDDRRTDSLAFSPSYHCLTNLNPADMADILSDTNRDERIAMFNLLDINMAADALPELPAKIQKELIESLERKKRLEVILQMPDNKIADLLNYLGPRRADEIARQLPPEKRDKIKGLLLHPEQTAGALMTTQYLSLNKDLTVEEAFTKAKESIANSPDLHFYYLYIMDGEQNLVGVMTIRKLLVSPPEKKLSEIMTSKMVKIKPLTRQHRIKDMVKKYNFSALPVVDAQNKLKGIILLKDILKNNVMG
ncbi:MAG: CBS domain-containing protein [Planctomycetota bacterium]|nr:CBS domain-containing protein [Planctomycetota bacterium]MDI6788525.1 CBS domain-containing protein [Planctomycetota bacterium]